MESPGYVERADSTLNAAGAAIGVPFSAGGRAVDRRLLRRPGARSGPARRRRNRLLRCPVDGLLRLRAGAARRKTVRVAGQDDVLREGGVSWLAAGVVGVLQAVLDQADRHIKRQGLPAEVVDESGLDEGLVPRAAEAEVVADEVVARQALHAGRQAHGEPGLLDREDGAGAEQVVVDGRVLLDPDIGGARDPEPDDDRRLAGGVLGARQVGSRAEEGDALERLVPLEVEQVSPAAVAGLDRHV